MPYSDLFFPFVFLPCSLLLYALVPRKLKNPTLVLLSLLFFGWGSPLSLSCLAGSLLLNYGAARMIAKAEEPGKKRTILLTVLGLDLLVLIFFRYGSVLFPGLGLSGGSWNIRLTAAPLGLCFITLSLLSFLLDVYSGRVEEVGSLTDFALYVSFFPKLILGPTVSYRILQPQLRNHPFQAERAFAGGRRFLIGLAKKVLIADTLGTIFAAVSANPVGRISMVSAWIGALCFGFMLYFAFSGYSDMAVGLGGVFGFSLPENFDYPYTSVSLTEFWRRWHTTLHDWFTDYVYRPLGGNRNGKARTIRNLAVVWLLTVLWHGPGWSILLCGVYHLGLLLLEKYVLNFRAQRMPRWLRRILTFLLVTAGWVFLFSPDPGTAFRYLHRLIGVFTVPFADEAAGYYLRGSWLMLAVAAVGCLPFVKQRCSILMQGKRLWIRAAALAIFGLLLWFCVARMVSDPQALIFRTWS